MSAAPNARAPEYDDTDQTARPARQGDPRTIVSTLQARQGITGQHVSYVLAFGMAAVVVAFAIIYFVYI